MRLPLLAALLALSAPARANLGTTDGQDFGNKLLKASNASVGSQFLSFPLPMSNVLKGRWQVGADAGYSSVDADVVKQKGPLFSVGATYAVADHFGVYGLAFHNRLGVSGGGQDVLLHPFANNVPLDTPERAEFSDVQGTIKQTGAGAALVWDPLVSSPDSDSLPLYVGLIFDSVQFDGVRADYRLLTGADAGSQGRLYYDATYSFVMPMLGAQYAKNLGSKWKVVPSLFFAKALQDKPQKGRITRTAGGSAFDISGTSGNAGFGEANFDVFVFAVGTTLVYRPWGLGANLGASAFRAAVGPSMYDGVKRVVQFDLSWRFGNYAR